MRVKNFVYSQCTQTTYCPIYCLEILLFLSCSFGQKYIKYKNFPLFSSIPLASMQFGSTAIIIIGVLAGVIIIGVVIFCCCRKKGKKEENAEG